MIRNTPQMLEQDATCDAHGAFVSRSMLLPLGRQTSWSSCPKCVNAMFEREAEERRQREAAENQRRLEIRLQRAGIPQRFRSRSFDNFHAAGKGQAEALRWAMDFADNFHERRKTGASMVFSGMPGTGKSHLAIAICMAVMTRGRGMTAVYLNAMDAIRLVRSTWGKGAERSEEAVLADLAGADLLVLDEVGAQYGTEGEQVILFDIINRRYQDLMPTILLTNQGVEGFKAYLGDRAFDRLREGGRWVAFDWESYRGKTA